MLLFDWVSHSLINQIQIWSDEHKQNTEIHADVTWKISHYLKFTLLLNVYDFRVSINTCWCSFILFASFHRWGSPIHNSGYPNDDGGLVAICFDCHLILHSKPCCFPHYHPHWKLHPVSRQRFRLIQSMRNDRRGQSYVMSVNKFTTSFWVKA